MLLGLKLKKCWEFYCTSLWRSNKLVHLSAKNVAIIIQNLMWNWVSLLLTLKNLRKTYKNCKNQTMLAKRRYTYFLRIKAQVKNLQKYLKPNFLVTDLFMVTFYLKKIFIKRILNSILTFINPRNMLFGWKSEENFWKFRCTGLL